MGVRRLVRHGLPEADPVHGGRGRPDDEDGGRPVRCRPDHRQHLRPGRQRPVPHPHRGRPDPADRLLLRRRRKPDRPVRTDRHHGADRLLAALRGCGHRRRLLRQRLHRHAVHRHLLGAARQQLHVVQRHFRRRPHQRHIRRGHHQGLLRLGVGLPERHQHHEGLHGRQPAGRPEQRLPAGVQPHHQVLGLRPREQRHHHGDELRRQRPHRRHRRHLDPPGRRHGRAREPEPVRQRRRGQRQLPQLHPGDRPHADGQHRGRGDRPGQVRRRLGQLVRGPGPRRPALRARTQAQRDRPALRLGHHHR